MTEELIRNIRVIHDLERAIRVWELVRDSTQQLVNETTACYEKQGSSVETNPTVAKARVDIATYNTTWKEGIRQWDRLSSLSNCGGESVGKISMTLSVRLSIN
jgi:hypothetical protein